MRSNQVDDYTLNLVNSPLAGDYLLAPLLETDAFTSPTITSEGGFEDYQLLAELPPSGRFTLQLQQP
jgi:hypothetical protein